MCHASREFERINRLVVMHTIERQYLVDETEFSEFSESNPQIQILTTVQLWIE